MKTGYIRWTKNWHGVRRHISRCGGRVVIATIGGSKVSFDLKPWENFENVADRISEILAGTPVGREIETLKNL